MFPNILSDNSVVPSFCSTATQGYARDVGENTNFALRLGEVKKIIYPTDQESTSGKMIEYHVSVQHKDGSGPTSTTLYKNCLLSNLFGSLGDVLKYTLRTDDKKDRPTSEYGIGAKVLILSINGEKTKSYIVGGIRDPKLDSTKEPNDGHNLYFEFNGLQFKINNDGEATATFRGKTNADATLADSANVDAEGTYLNFNKDGNLELSTPGQDQFIRLNHKDKKIEILAADEWNVEVDGKLVFKAGSEIEVTGGSTANLSVPGNVSISSSGVLVGSATDAWIKGTTYRNAESMMNNNMSSIFSNLSELIQKAGEQLVAGNTSGAGAILVAVGPIMSTLSNAIKAFEDMSSSYLSTKNKTD